MCVVIAGFIVYVSLGHFIFSLSFATLETGGDYWR